MNFTYHEERLLQRLDEDQKAIYLDVKHKLSGGALNFSSANLRHYTDHGCQHSKNIIIQISSMIPDSILENMRSFEILILLCSAWLHDIGLLAEKDEKGCNLSGKEIRERHHELGRFVIREMHDELGIDDEGLADIIANVCYCHRRKISINEYMEEIDRIQTEEVRQHFLAAILRLADAFDTTSMRMPAILSKLFWDTSEEISQIHLTACKLIQAITYEIRCNSIVVRAHFKNEEEERILQWKIASLFKEFESVKEILIKNRLLYLHIQQKIKNLETEEEIESTEKPLLTRENLPTALSLEEWRQRENFHIQRKEYIFAADCCWKSYQLLLERDGEAYALKYINKAIKHIKATEGYYPDRRYFLRILHKYYSILKKNLENLKLNKEEQVFFEDISFIQRTLDTIEKEYLSRCHSLYIYSLLFGMGRSPLRKAIRTAWPDFKEKNVEKDGSLHSDCCLCTANYVIVSTLIGEKKEAERSFEWLLNQENNEWRTQNNIKRGFDYTSLCLNALFEWYYPHHDNSREILEIVNLLLRNRAAWGNIRHLSRMNTLTDIIFPLGLLSVRYPGLREDIHKAIEKEILAFLENFQNAANVDQEESLRGILFFDKVTNEKIQRKMKELAKETINRIRHDPNWNRKTGMWGSETLSKTGNRVYNWLLFWELILKIDENET